MPIEIGISTTIGGIAGNTPGGGTVPFTNTKSIDLDGVDDMVDCGNIKPTGAMTISYWFKGKSSSSNATTLGTMGNSGQRGYMLGVNNGTRFFFSIASSATAVKTIAHTLTFDDTKWYHLVGVYNPSTYMRIYIDGNQVAEVTSAIPSSQYVGNSITTKIGSRGDDGAFGRFVGNIDEVAFFDSALSVSDITAIYGSGVPTSLASLNPLSWYRCGDGDTAPTLTDNGSGGNNATMENFNTFSADVPTVSSFSNLKSIDLDGVDDFVTMGNPSNLNFERTDSFSISVWFKKASFGGAQFIIGKNQNAVPRNGYFVFTSGNLVHLRLTTSGGSLITIRHNVAHNLNVWEHYVFTYDGSSSNSGLNMYQNGTLLTNVTRSGAALTQSIQTTFPFTLGARQGLGLFAAALIDEVGVFNSELSASDVTAIYGTGVPTSLSSYSSLISWWRCGDGDTSPTLTDNGSGGNNGTMTNFSTFSTDVPT